ncbi:MAG: aminotransferase class V-fold PLP-dependent enzyme, partial [Dehalococcoidia bacterium]|nr:aminotransferase class V-fold PLP-dependent enzyme [Dehalococcoidia bacterium]
MDIMKTKGLGVYDALGVKRVINASSWLTTLGGSIMYPEVVQAMVGAADCFVDIRELNRKAGETIAQYTGAEAGLVTSGAAGAMTLQAAACMTGKDRTKISRLPDSTGMKNEIIMMRGHRIGFDRAFTSVGARIVDVGTARSSPIWTIEAAINERTVAIAYVVGWGISQSPSLEEVIEIVHKHGLPVIVDAAAMLPPEDNLTKFIAMGADLVCFSGGKGLRGPQSTGILCGQRELMEAAVLNASPNMSIGRPMKVCKEEIIGLITALELFVQRDHQVEWEEWRSRSQAIVEALQGIPGVNVIVEKGNREGNLNREGPQAVITFDTSWKGLSIHEIKESLLSGDPPIYVGHGLLGYADKEINIAPQTLKDGEEKVIAERLCSLLTL